MPEETATATEYTPEQQKEIQIMTFLQENYPQALNSVSFQRDGKNHQALVTKDGLVHYRSTNAVWEHVFTPYGSFSISRATEVNPRPLLSEIDLNVLIDGANTTYGGNTTTVPFDDGNKIYMLAHKIDWAEKYHGTDGSVANDVKRDLNAVQEEQVEKQKEEKRKEFNVGDVLASLKP